MSYPGNSPRINQQEEKKGCPLETGGGGVKEVSRTNRRAAAHARKERARQEDRYLSIAGIQTTK